MPEPIASITDDPSPPITAADALRTRRSVRAFLPDPVARDTVEDILALASRSPSGSNIQPWRVRVVAGAAREALVSAVLHAATHPEPDAPPRQWHYYPRNWREPYLARRRKVGWDMYKLVGVTKGDVEGTKRQHLRNFNFFDAPVGMILTLDADLEVGSWIDLGIFIGAITIAARAKGLHTCAQAAFADYPGPIRKALGIPDDQVVICGIALGHADPDAVVNRLVTERANPDEFATFDGF